MNRRGERPGWRLVEWAPLDGGEHSLLVRAGASSGELAACAAEMPAAILTDVLATRPVGSGVVMTFREFPPGVVVGSGSGSGPGLPGGDDPAAAPTVAAGVVSGWVPDVGQQAAASRGFTPFDLAVWELVTAARDGAAGAWITTLIRLVPPAAVVALADLLREQRRGRR